MQTNSVQASSGQTSAGQSIQQRLTAARQRISDACQQAGRDPGTVQLLAVSKTQPVSAVREAIAAGQRAFGENYLQDALVKIDALREECAGHPLEWHFIGPLQSNKSRPVAEQFDWVHSVDRLKLARRLSEQRPESLPPLNICLQVNVSQESSKSGISFAELPALAAQIATLPRLSLRGLMAIPAATDDPEQQQAAFAQLQQAFSELKQSHPSLDTLSMGMSGDLEAAVSQGSTLVRIGTAIFGPRQSAGSAAAN